MTVRDAEQFAVSAGKVEPEGGDVVAGKVEDVFCSLWVSGEGRSIKLLHKLVDNEVVVCLGCSEERGREREGGGGGGRAGMH